MLPANVYWTITISKIGNAEIAESEKECLQFEYYNKMLEQAKAECTDSIEKNADAIEFLRQPIPSYYFDNNYIESKINEIREHTRTARGISFAFITDVHIKNNVGNSKFLLKHILDRTTVPFIICGGDIGSAYSAEYGKEKEETISEANQWLDYIGYVGKDLVFQVRGNHDHNKQSETGAGDKKYYSMFDYEVYDYNTRSLESKVNTHPNRNYY